MGLNGTLWGWHLWPILHINAKLVDQYRASNDKVLMEKSERLLEWLRLTCDALPCDWCEGHCRTMLMDIPIPATKEEGSVFSWSVTIHNKVNKRLGKREISDDEAWDLLTKENDEDSLKISQRAEKIRQQDHAKIKEMKDQLDIHGLGNSSTNSKRIMLVTIGLIIGSMLVGFIWLMVFLTRP